MGSVKTLDLRRDSAEYYGLGRKEEAKAAGFTPAASLVRRATPKRNHVEVPWGDGLADAFSRLAMRKLALDGKELKHSGMFDSLGSQVVSENSISLVKDGQTGLARIATAGRYKKHPWFPGKRQWTEVKPSECPDLVFHNGSVSGARVSGGAARALMYPDGTVGVMLASTLYCGIDEPVYIGSKFERKGFSSHDGFAGSARITNLNVLESDVGKYLELAPGFKAVVREADSEARVIEPEEAIVVPLGSSLKIFEIAPRHYEYTAKARNRLEGSLPFIAEYDALVVDPPNYLGQKGTVKDIVERIIDRHLATASDVGLLDHAKQILSDGDGSGYDNARLNTLIPKIARDCSSAGLGIANLLLEQNCPRTLAMRREITQMGLNRLMLEASNPLATEIARLTIQGDEDTKYAVETAKATMVTRRARDNAVTFKEENSLATQNRRQLLEDGHSLVQLEEQATQNSQRAETTAANHKVEIEAIRVRGQQANEIAMGSTPSEIRKDKAMDAGVYAVKAGADVATRQNKQDEKILDARVYAAKAGVDSFGRQNDRDEKLLDARLRAMETQAQTPGFNTAAIDALLKLSLFERSVA